MRRFTILALLATLAGAGCGSDEGDERIGPSLSEQRERLRGAPPPLAALHAQANELIEGGREALDARLRELRGYPVVVNMWGSWCTPCRNEFPHFQSEALTRGKRIAFLGLDGQDNDANARAFLAKIPVSYPSYKDPDTDIARRRFKAVGFPTTAFVDSKGEIAFVKQGPYSSAADLAKDIERYAR